MVTSTGRTQRGNNNAYSQDNEITWYDWSNVDAGLFSFTKDLLQLRVAHPVFRRRRFLQGVEAAELQWFNTQGAPMSQGDWTNGWTRCLTIYLDGSDDPDTDSDGHPLFDDDFLLLVNGWEEPVEFTVPAVGRGRPWATVIDTGRPAGDPTGPAASATGVGGAVLIADFSLVVLRSDRPISVPASTPVI